MKHLRTCYSSSMNVRWGLRAAAPVGLAVLVLLLLVTPTLAQDVVTVDVGNAAAEQAPAPEPWPWDQARDVFTRLPERIVSALWEMTGGNLLKLLAAIVGFFLTVARALAGGLLGDINFFTQIPEPWVTLSALEGLRARLVPLAVGIGGLALVLVLLRTIGGLVFGLPYPGVLGSVVKVAALAPLVGASPVLMLHVIRAGNALAAALGDTAGGLPGLGDVGGFDRMAAEGIASLFYFFALAVLWWIRVQLVLTALLLFVASPLAIACFVLPFALPQWVARTWATLFIGAVSVQVLQALTLGIGAGLLTANVVAEGVEGVGGGVLNLGLAAGMVMATSWIPRRVLGALVAHQPPGYGWLATGLKAGVMLSGAGWVPAAASVPLDLARRAVVRPAPPASAPSTPSLPHSRRLLLPPPKD